ncbi:MAG: glycosyltransferase family 4 protein [Alphaproteobacteria bacterium]|nr:glycosyltransferase family 4 protein [Alphaproteobacteria bacterium]
MRILFLTRYGRLGASSRQRCVLYVDTIAAAGVESRVCPFFGDDYVRRLYSGGAASIVTVLRAYASRLGALLRIRGYDLLWLEKEALPWVPAWLELSFFKAAGAKIVVDYDDALFHAYDQHRNWLIRKLLGSKIDRIMASADLVCVGNSYIGHRAKAAGANKIAELPTVVDLRLYPVRRSGPSSEKRPFTLGWIGSPVTSSYLNLLRPALAQLERRLQFRFVLIGAAPDALADFPVERVTWSAETEAAELACCDVGVMPLPDLPWERGKCGYKLIQYMASSLPAVASPVGVNCDIVVPGETGFLAKSPAEWVSSLLRLAQDPALRHRMGAAGRRRVETYYSLEVRGPELIELLYSVGAPSSKLRARAATPGIAPASAAHQRPF